MKDSVESMACFAIGAILIVVVVIASDPVEDGREQIRREAVLKGHAEYTYDKDGAPVFTWKEVGK